MTPEWELLMADTSCAYLLLFLSGDFFSLAMSSMPWLWVRVKEELS